MSPCALVCRFVDVARHALQPRSPLQSLSITEATGFLSNQPDMITHREAGMLLFGGTLVAAVLLLGGPLVAAGGSGMVTLFSSTLADVDEAVL